MTSVELELWAYGYGWVWEMSAVYTFYDFWFKEQGAVV
jgi:hypothetical protein